MDEFREYDVTLRYLDPATEPGGERVTREKALRVVATDGFAAVRRVAVDHVARGYDVKALEAHAVHPTEEEA